MKEYKEFDNWTLEEFNRMCDTNILPTDNFQEIGDKIDEAEISYFYISMNESDVLEAIEDEKEVAEMLDLRLLYIEEIGIYIATY
jgi:hypothetical protein